MDDQCSQHFHSEPHPQCPVKVLEVTGSWNGCLRGMVHHKLVVASSCSWRKHACIACVGKTLVQLSLLIPGAVGAVVNLLGPCCKAASEQSQNAQDLDAKPEPSKSECHIVPSTAHDWKQEKTSSTAHDSKQRAFWMDSCRLSHQSV